VTKRGRKKEKQTEIKCVCERERQIEGGAREKHEKEESVKRVERGEEKKDRERERRGRHKKRQ
jgi:hypothetical protein